MSARFGAADYAAAAHGLMPRGAVWPSDPGSTQGKVLGAFAQALQRVDAAAGQLVVDAFPGTTEALLDAWEASLGLPDPTIEAGATDAQRQAMVVARLAGAAGQSRARFIAFAATLGFTISIANYSPLRSGHFAAGDGVYGPAWADAWAIHITANSGGLSPSALKTEIDAIRPAETTTLIV